jgi:hypothetical protein
MEKPSTKEIESILERASQMFDSSGDEYLDGVVSALGWVMGLLDDPLDEYDIG